MDKKEAELYYDKLWAIRDKYKDRPTCTDAVAQDVLRLCDLAERMDQILLNIRPVMMTLTKNSVDRHMAEAWEEFSGK